MQPCAWAATLLGLCSQLGAGGDAGVASSEMTVGLVEPPGAGAVSPVLGIRGRDGSYVGKTRATAVTSLRIGPGKRRGAS